MSKEVKDKVKKLRKELKQKFGRVVVPLLIGGATIGAVKGCEHMENEKANNEFKTEFADADYIEADAAHNHFRAYKDVKAPELMDKKKIIEIRKELKRNEDLLAKMQQKDDENFLKACKNGTKADVVKALPVARINAVDKDGNTGLMLALQNKNFASSYNIAKYLLEQGIIVNQKNKEGLTAFDLVEQKSGKSWNAILDTITITPHLNEAASLDLEKKEFSFSEGQVAVTEYGCNDAPGYIKESSDKKALFDKIMELKAKVDWPDEAHYLTTLVDVDGKQGKEYKQELKNNANKRAREKLINKSKEKN